MLIASRVSVCVREHSKCVSPSRSGSSKPRPPPPPSPAASRSLPRPPVPCWGVSPGWVRLAPRGLSSVCHLPGEDLYVRVSEAGWWRGGVSVSAAAVEGGRGLSIPTLSRLPGCHGAPAPSPWPPQTQMDGVYLGSVPPACVRPGVWASPAACVLLSVQTAPIGSGSLAPIRPPTLCVCVCVCVPPQALGVLGNPREVRSCVCACVCFCLCLRVGASGGVWRWPSEEGKSSSPSRQSPAPHTHTHTLATSFRGDPDRQTDTDAGRGVGGAEGTKRGCE